MEISGSNGGMSGNASNTFKFQFSYFILAKTALISDSLLIVTNSHTYFVKSIELCTSNSLLLHNSYMQA